MHLESKQLATREPLYDVHPVTGRTVEVFFMNNDVAASFGLRTTGWAWWSCAQGQMPDHLPHGPFATSYSAYRDAILSCP